MQGAAALINDDIRIESQQREKHLHSSLCAALEFLRTASSCAWKVFVGSPMENTANAKLTAYVAELNAAKHAVHRLRQIEQHLQETVQRQEDELVKLRLSQFKSDSDKNLSKHLKARIAVQADEYEKLRGRALRAKAGYCKGSTGMQM